MPGVLPDGGVWKEDRGKGRPREDTARRPRGRKTTEDPVRRWTFTSEGETTQKKPIPQASSDLKPDVICYRRLWVCSILKVKEGKEEGGRKEILTRKTFQSRW